MDVDACILLDTKASTYLGALSPLGSRVATASEDGEVRVWYAGGLGDPVVITAHDDAIEVIDFSLDGERIVTASQDQTARVHLATAERTIHGTRTGFLPVKI
ncbi:MAG: WD40 repeat domain-containing protein [bacterium]|nr:WD40 repeat domain-containing protein [bacterium]